MGLIFRLVTLGLAYLSDFLRKTPAKIYRTDTLPYLRDIEGLRLEFWEKIKAIQNDQREGRPEALFLSDQDSAPFGVIFQKFMTLLFPTYEREKLLLHFPGS